MIKPDELMIGDWVYNKHHKKNIRITPFDYFAHGHLPSGKQYFIDEPEIVSGKDFDAIPLTPEILEKNGFMLQDSWYCRVIGDDKIYVNLPEEENIYQYTDIEYQKLVYNLEDVTEVEYSASMTFKGTISVHQLQHALKLCGIEKEIEL